MRTGADHVAVVLLALATTVGVFLGLRGPATSPVSPGTPPVPVVSGLIGRINSLPVNLGGGGPGPGGGRR